MIVAIIQARMGSTRLPGKILKPILGRPMLSLMLERVKRTKRVDAVVVATTDKVEDDATADLAKKCGAIVFRGSEGDVLDRFYKAAKEVKANTIVRLTGDCPIMDPDVIDMVIERFETSREKVDYSSTPNNYPEGLDIEIFTFATLEKAAQNAKLPSEREHVSVYIKNHPESFKCESWREGEGDNSSLHWSVDTISDFEFVTKVFEYLYPSNPNFNKHDVLTLLKKHPELLDINKGGTGYEGLAKSLKEDEQFKKSKND